MKSSLTLDLLRLSYVPRWVIMPMMRAQSVAEHSFRVAAIAADLAAQWEPRKESPGFEVIVAALVHDADEAYTGDVPGNIKRRYPTLKDNLGRIGSSERGRPLPEYTPRAVAIVKLADVIETLTYLRVWGLGNTRSRLVVHEIIDVMSALKGTVPIPVWSRAERLVGVILEEADGPSIDDSTKGGKGGPGKRKVPGSKGKGGRNVRKFERPTPDPIHPSPAGDGEGGGAV